MVTDKDFLRKYHDALDTGAPLVNFSQRPIPQTNEAHDASPSDEEEEDDDCEIPISLSFEKVLKVLRANVRDISDSQNSFGDLLMEAEDNNPSTVSEIPPASFQDANNGMNSSKGITKNRCIHCFKAW